MSNRNQTATYDNPIVVSHSRGITALNTGAEKARFRGPPGLRGKVVSVQGTITTSVTTAAAPLTLGSTTDADAYLTTTVPVGTAPVGFAATQAQLDAGGVVDEIPADTDVLITAGGAAGAGAATVEVTVAWYK